MKISVIGCGYLGAVHAAAMAKLGHEVVGIDIDDAKISSLQESEAPFFEPGLPELLREGQESGSLHFSKSFKDAEDSDVHFLCVGTPQKKGEYAADLTYVDAAFRNLLMVAKPGAVIVGKSTVPVGTATRLHEEMRRQVNDVSLIWNPEFLREGHAVKDTLSPDRLVYGVENLDAASSDVQILDNVYEQILETGIQRLVMNFATSELVKASANSFLATKISFINAMAEICELTGADVSQLADAIGLDDRIGRKFLNAGVGFGGGCLPKDIRAFMARAGELGADQALTFLKEVDSINMRRRARVVELARETFSGSLIGRRITVLGASFKPNSDDVRDSPALSIAAQLQLQGAAVNVTDPKGISNAKKRFPELNYVEDLKSSIVDAELIILLTEWSEYVEMDPAFIAREVKSTNIIDGRNCLDRELWLNAGWNYRGIGR